MCLFVRGGGIMCINAASPGVPTVDPADHSSTERVSDGTEKQRGSLASFGLLAASSLLLIAVLVANFESQRVVLALRICLTGATLVFALLLANFIRERRRSERQAQTVFEDNVQDFQHMADNIQEIFWMMDPKTKKATFVNPAYEAITGRSCQSLLDEPSWYEKVIHPEDRAHVLSKLERAAKSGHFDERFRILRPNGEVRWVWVRGFPRHNARGTLFRLGGTALDITALKKAEDQVAANLASANSAWAEAEALRKATLALTEDLHMDCVLETLLCSLAELVPYTCARVHVYVSYALARNIKSDDEELRFSNFTLWCVTPQNIRTRVPEPLRSSARLYNWVYERPYNISVSPSEETAFFGSVYRDYEDTLFLLRLFRVGDLVFLHMDCNSQTDSFFANIPKE